METLEDIFKDSKKRMQSGVYNRDVASQAKVHEIIRTMENDILGDLKEKDTTYISRYS